MGSVFYDMQILIPKSLLSSVSTRNMLHHGLILKLYFDEWIGLVDEFVECVRNGKTPKINLDWHKNTIAAMNACYKSITTGKAVKL